MSRERVVLAVTHISPSRTFENRKYFKQIDPLQSAFITEASHLYILSKHEDQDPTGLLRMALITGVTGTTGFEGFISHL